VAVPPLEAAGACVTGGGGAASGAFAEITGGAVSTTGASAGAAGAGAGAGEGDGVTGAAGRRMGLGRGGGGGGGGSVAVEEETGDVSTALVSTKAVPLGARLVAVPPASMKAFSLAISSSSKLASAEPLPGMPAFVQMSTSSLLSIFRSLASA